MRGGTPTRAVPAGQRHRSEGRDYRNWQDRALPLFSTVVLAEISDKACAEFTSVAMNIFKTFWFQMVVR
jgi:hypothetical protein